MSSPPLTVEVEQVSAGEPIDLAWAKRVEQLQLDALPAIRASAERWAGALTALLGAVGLAALINGPGRFDGLEGSSELVGKTSFLLALVLSLIASGLAVSAAQVTSKRLLLPTLGAYRDAIEEAVSTAVTCIRISRWLALAAVLATLVAGLTLWLGDASQPATKSILIRGCAGVEGSSSFKAPPETVVRCVPR